LIHGPCIAVSLGIKRLFTCSDSKDVIDQINNVCDIRKDSMNAYCAEVRKLEAHFEGLEFHHVCRENNVATDVLSKLESKRALVPTGLFVRDLHKPSIRLNNLETPQSDISPPGSRDVLMVEAEDD
jgi:hypothetical protein